jgi:hypothetical protein
MTPSVALTRVDGAQGVTQVATRPRPGAQPLPPVPRWSLLALERNGTRTIRATGLSPRAHPPVFAIFVAVLGGLAAGSWIVATLASVCTFAVVTGVLRLPAMRRWIAAQELVHRHREAFALRSELASFLTEPLRSELARLESLVDAIRWRENRRGSSSKGTMESPLLRRLDGLLMLYVDLAIEVRTASVGIAMTADAAPCVTAGPTPEDPRDIDAAEREAGNRSHRIARLRIRARDRCRGRIDRLNQELAEIGQLVRLVHEQSLTSRYLDGDLEQTLADVLDEAENAWQAHAEVAAVVGQDPAA